jgi:GNAT superfamily N-acetyltransferase
MRIRAAASGDLMSIGALTKTTPWEESNFVKRAIDLGHVSVAVEHDIIRGFIVLNDEFFEKPFVWLIVVDSNHRRLGIGTKLFEYVEARHAGYRLYTSTNRSNYIMAAFLSVRGYAVVGEIDLDPGDPEIFYEQSRHAG